MGVASSRMLGLQTVRGDRSFFRSAQQSEADGHLKLLVITCRSTLICFAVERFAATPATPAPRLRTPCTQNKEQQQAAPARARATRCDGNKGCLAARGLAIAVAVAVGATPRCRHGSVMPCHAECGSVDLINRRCVVVTPPPLLVAAKTPPQSDCRRDLSACGDCIAFCRAVAAFHGSQPMSLGEDGCSLPSVLTVHTLQRWQEKKAGYRWARRDATRRVRPSRAAKQGRGDRTDWHTRVVSSRRVARVQRPTDPTHTRTRSHTLTRRAARGEQSDGRV